MNSNVQILYRLAEKWGFPLHYSPEGDVLVITLARRHYYFLGSRTFLNEGGAIYVSGNKYIANYILNKSGFSVAKSILFDKDDYQAKDLSELIGNLTFPLVAKPPRYAGKGAFVFSKIRDKQTLAHYLEKFFKMYDSVIIQEFHGQLNEYRVLVLKNKIVGILSRTGAFVRGDGKHSIEELISIKNEKRLNSMKTRTISPLVYDDEYQNCLDEAGLSLNDIPFKNQHVRLCYTVNSGRGGEVGFHSTKIDRQNAKKLIESVHALGLEYGGIDLLCEDLNKPFNEQRWIIIEINSCPDISVHEMPNRGKKVPVASFLLWELIKRHPFAYLKHRLKKGNFSFYLKIVFCFVGLFFILYSME